MTTKTKKSSTGGTIVYTATGLSHYGNEQDNEGSGYAAPKFDFSAFVTPVTLTSPTGRIVRFK